MFKVILVVCLYITSISIFAQADKVENAKSSQTFYKSEDWVSDGTFTQGIEGPAVSKSGDLYVVNYQQDGTIGRVVGKNEVELLIKLDNGSIGNGIRFDTKGNMYIADYVNHNVLYIEKSRLDGSVLSGKEATVYTHEPLMNQPNDIAIMDNGIIFASDPNWSTSTGKLWRINQNGKTILLEKNMGTTNGIAVSPDNKTLYINESVQRKVFKYQLDKNGNISGKSLLIHFDDFGLDGMRTDKNGNLYIARYGKGVIAIVSPQGKLLREVVLKGKFPTNVAFGGVNGKTVFVTLQKRGAIEKFMSEFSGRNSH